MPVLMEYIGKMIEEGKSIEQIRKELINNNFPKSTVDSAINEYLLAHPEPEKKGFFSKLFKKGPKPEKKPKKIIEKEKPQINEIPSEAPSKEPAPTDSSIKKYEKILSQVKVAPKKKERRHIRWKLPKWNNKPKKEHKFKSLKMTPHFIKIYGIVFLTIIVFAGIFIGVRAGFSDDAETVDVSSLPQIDCSKASLKVNSAEWNHPDTLVVTLNDGLVDLTGFEAIVIDDNLERMNTSLTNPDVTISANGGARKFRITGINGCFNVNTITLRSLQCPDRALHTIQRNDIVGCV